MPITTKDAVLKRLYEENGQQQMFGYDNLQFKTVNHPTSHRLVNLCKKFKLKQAVKNNTNLPFMETVSIVVLGQVYSADRVRSK